MFKDYEKDCVVTDGYSGYNFLDSDEEYKNISHAFSWAHVGANSLKQLAMASDQK